MIERPFFTVIVPVYNIPEQLLKVCLKSLLGQTEKNYEILIVDDGSAKACHELCDDFANKHEKIRVVHQENGGLSVARNTGVRESRGEWILFVDGDDWIEANTLEWLLQTINSSPKDTDLVVWDAYSENGKESCTIDFMEINDTELHVYRGKEKDAILDGFFPLVVSSYSIDRCTDIGVTWSHAYRKEMLTENNITNPPGIKMMQDSVFNLWVLNSCRAIVYQKMYLYHYLFYNESGCQKYDKGIIRNAESLYEEYMRYCNSLGAPEELKRRINNRMMRVLIKCISKDYANPSNPSSIAERASSLRWDIKNTCFKKVIKECRIVGKKHDFRFIVACICLKLRLCMAIIFLNEFRTKK